MKKITLFIASLFIAMASFAEIKVDTLWTNTSADINEMKSGIGYLNGELLVPSTASANGYIYIYDAATGLAKTDADGKRLMLDSVVGLAFNDLKVNDIDVVNGNIYAFNGGVNTHSRLYHWTSKLATPIRYGTNGDIATLTTGFDIKVDENGNGMFFAVRRDGTKQTYATVANYVVKDFVNLTVDLTALGLGTGSGNCVDIVNDSTIWVDNANSAPILFRFNKTAGTFTKLATISSDKINGTSGAGIEQFSVKGYNYVVVATCNHGTATGFPKNSIMVYQLNDDYSVTPVTGYLPGSDLYGYATANGTNVVEPTVVVDGDVVTIYHIGANGGMAAHKLSGFPEKTFACSTVAEVKAVKEANAKVTLNSNAVVTFIVSDGIILEDATGAIKAQSYAWSDEQAKGLVAGKKITSVSGYANYEEDELDWWGRPTGNKLIHSGVIYTPETEKITYTLGDSVGVTYAAATPKQILTAAADYEYEALKLQDVNIQVTASGDRFVETTDTILPIYTNAVLPTKATLYGYYGEHPYGADYGNVFTVMNAEFSKDTLKNVNIISEFDKENYSEAKYVMLDGKKYRLSYDTSNKLPRTCTTLVGYLAMESYYAGSDPNTYEEIYATREVFVVADYTYETVAINDFVATTEGSYKYVTYNGEKLRLQAPYGTSIPGMGNLTGYVYEQAGSSATTLCLWIVTVEGTGYSNINEYKTAVGAGKTAEKAATVIDPMIVSHVYTAGEQTTLFVKQGSNYYAAIRTTATDKNGKAYAAGDSIKGVKGIMTAFGYDNTAAEIITGTYLTVEAGLIEITSSGNAVPNASSLYGLQYLTGSSKRSAGSYEARYMTVPVGELKKLGNDYYFFSDNGDSILVVAPFAITDAMLGKVGLKAFTDVKNSSDKVQLILTAESDIIPSNVKFNSIADMKAAGAAASGITYELVNPVLLTYIEKNSETNWSTMEDVAKYYLYVQDATGGLRIDLDTVATRLFTGVVGDSIVGFKGIYSTYGLKIAGAETTHTVKNSGNALVPEVITIQQYLEAKTAGTYNAKLVRFEGVDFVERDTTVYSTTRKDRDFIQGDYKITYSRSNFEDYLGGFTFYPTNNITAIADNSWMTSTYGFMPISQDAIENAVSQEEGATILSIRNNTESKPVKFTGKATSTYLTERGIIIQDGTGAILLDGVDSVAVDRSITNVEGTYYPSSADCMARIVPTALENTGRGRLSKETVTIDSLVNNIANFEGEIVDIAVAQTTRVSEGVYTMATTDGATIAVRGAVVPSDAKLTGLIYHTSAAQGQAFTVTAYDFYNTGSNRVLMFHELKDYMAKWAPVTSEQYTISGFTSPVLVNSVFSSQGGTALNVQQTNADGSVTGLTIWAMETAEKFAAGDSIYFVKGGYVPFQDLSGVYGQEGYSRGRCIQAYRYDYHVGDIDYPADVDSIKNDDGEMILPPIVEVQLGTLIKKLNSGNKFAYEEISDISGFFGATAVDYQAKNYQLTGTIVVDTTSYEWDGETVYEYATSLKVGENKLLLSGADLKLFANQEVTIKGNFDIGYALEDRASFYISSLSNVNAGVALAANIAEFIELANTEEEVLILSELAVTYQNGANIYVRDNSGSLLIYDFDYQNAGYVNGDRLNGVKGKFKNYNGLPEMVDATLPAAVAGDAVAPRAISIADLATAGLNEYVVINEVKFAEALAFTAENRNATITNDAEETAALYNNFKLEASWGVQTPVSIVGTVGIYKENRQLNYISHEMFAVDFANINAIYRKGHWEASRYEDYSYGSVVARLNSQPTVVDMVQTAGMMGGTSNNYYLNDGTGVVVLQAPASGEDWMGNPVEGLELTVGQKLPEGLLANINFNAIVNDTTYLPTGEVYGAPVLSFVQEVTGVDADGYDTYQPYSEFAAGCVESDFVEDTVVVSLAEVLANRIDYAGKLLAVDTVGNYFAEVAMDHFTGTTSTSAYLFWDAEEAFDVEVYEEEGETYVYVSPKMTEDWYNYAGELFNLKAENLEAAALTDSATIALDVVRFDWNSIAQGQSLMLKGEYTIDNPNSPGVDVENSELVVNVYANNGSVYVETEAGVMIEVYTVNGLRVYAGVSNTTTTVINGLSDIAIIRVNGQAYKVFVK